MNIELIFWYLCRILGYAMLITGAFLIGQTFFSIGIFLSVAGFAMLSITKFGIIILQQRLNNHQLDGGE
jgi:hypothetical protein